MASAQVVGATGATLVLLNTWTGPGRAQLNGLFDSNASPADTQTAHQEMIKIAASLLFVGALTLIAGESAQAGNVAMAIIAALFIVWSINRYAKKN